MPLSWAAMALAVCAGGLPGAALALGVSNPLTHSSLGQPLNLLFPLRLNPDETLSRDCVRAEVMAGEARLPQGLVQFRLESDGAGHVRGVRLLSSVQVDEPIVTVNLSLGCPTQLTRQFTAFVDPPDARPTVAAPLAADVMPVAESAAAAPAPAMEVKPAASTPPTGTARLVAQAPASPPKPRPKPRPKPVAVAAAAPAASVAAVETPVPKPAAATAPVSRLRMDPLDVPVETAAAAAASAPLPVPVTDETLARLQQLEDKLDQVHKENVAAEDQFKLLRAQLEEARDQRYRNVLVYGLGVFLAALALICAYLWTILRRERDQRERDWRHEADRMRREREASEGAAAAHPAAVVPAMAAPQRTPTPPPSSPLPPFSPAYQAPRIDASHGVAQDSRTLPAIARPALGSILQDEGDPPTTMASAFVDAPQGGSWLAPAAGSEREAQPTAPLPLMQEAIQLAPAVPKARSAANSVVLDDENHEVSVEELIDLEQQVDFFEVLGQDGAAIDLLTLRIASGQESALPYLKLMEIYQRRGDEAAFNSLHGDFARNFKAVPPSWGAKLNEGRGLESYPRVLDIVQQYWSDAGASMALLQNLLSHGGEDAQGFDLPAYRDLLMLYGLARDQSEREVRGEPIDLFLPLDSGASSSAGTSMMATQPVAPSAETIHLDLSLDIDLDAPPAAPDSR